MNDDILAGVFRCSLEMERSLSGMLFSLLKKKLLASFSLTKLMQLVPRDLIGISYMIPALVKLMILPLMLCRCTNFVDKIAKARILRF